MTITFIQKTGLGSTASATTLSSGAFGVNPTVGNYVVVWVWTANKATAWTGANLTCTDNIGGNTYAQSGFSGNSLDDCCAIFHCKVAATGGSFSVSVTIPSATALCVTAAEFAGIDPTAPVDGAAVGAAGATGIPAPGSMSFTAGDLVCADFTDDGSGSVTVTTPAGFTSAQKQANGSGAQIGDSCYAIGPTSPTNPAWNTQTNTWSSLQVAFLADAAVGGGGGGGDSGSSGGTGMQRPVAAGWV